jgi:hypothetical protein
MGGIVVPEHELVYVARELLHHSCAGDARSGAPSALSIASSSKMHTDMQTLGPRNPHRVRKSLSSCSISLSERTARPQQPGPTARRAPPTGRAGTAVRVEQRADRVVLHQHGDRAVVRCRVHLPPVLGLRRARSHTGVRSQKRAPQRWRGAGSSWQLPRARRRSRRRAARTCRYRCLESER